MSAGNRRYLGIAIVVILLVGVALIAFGLGSANGGRGFFGDMPRPGYLPRGQGVGMGVGLGGGLVWLLLLVGLGLLFVVGLVKVLEDRTPPPPTGSAQAPTASAPTATHDGIDRLRELAELHDRGKLTDEEFTAAKRRLLGL